MYHYRVTVELLGTQPSENRSMQFEADNHDDLLQITEVIRSKEIVDASQSAGLAIGLKLFAEVVLDNRRHPLFEPMLEPLKSFTLQLKEAGLSE